MVRALFVASVLLVATTSCKRETASGLAPAKDWQSTKDQPEAVQQPAQQPAQTMPPASNPHAGMQMPNDGSSNPHAGMSGGGGGASSSSGGGGGMPTAEATAPKSLDKLPDGRLLLGPFALKLPDGWSAKPVTSSMRAADFLIGSDGSELIVYYSGQSGMGSVQDNVDRWESQLVRTDGKSAKDVAKVEQVKLAGQDATIISTTGHYHAESMMAGQAATDFPDGELLAAIINSPAGPYYLKGVGSKATMDANAAKFRAMLSSLEIH